MFFRSTIITFGSKANHDVSDSAVQLLKGQRGDVGPDVQGVANGSVHISLLQVWGVIQDPATIGRRISRREGPDQDENSALESPLEAAPECDIVVWPFEVSREVVVLPDVWDPTPGLLHQLQSVLVQVSRYLFKWEEAAQRDEESRLSSVIRSPDNSRVCPTHPPFLTVSWHKLVVTTWLVVLHPKAKNVK